MIAVGSDPEPAFSLGKNAVIAHDSSNAVLAAQDAAPPEIPGDPGAAVSHSALLMSAFDLFQQAVILLFSEAFGSLSPRVIRAP